MRPSKYSFLFSLLCTLIISNTTIYSQNATGRVLDSDNNPIAFATIQIGENFGVITNEEGNYSIDIKRFNPKDSVSISCLGFDKTMILLENFTSKEYILNEQINELSEVYLTNKSLSIDSIMIYVKNNLKKNYRFQLNEFNLFSRKTEYIRGKNVNFEIKKSTGFKKKQLKLFNTDFDKLETSLLHNTSKQYTEFIGTLKILNEEKAKLNVDKALQLLDERNNQSIESLTEKGNDIVLKHLDKEKVYTVKSGLFKVSDSMSIKNNNDEVKDSINSIENVKNVTFNMIKNYSLIDADSKLDFVLDNKKYKYELNGITFLDDEVVYIITFIPKKSSAKYTGTMYVSNETFAVLRADYKFYKNRVGQKINLKLVLGVKFIENNNAGLVVYKKDLDGYYYPSYMNEQIDRYFYVDRPVKFIENGNKRNKVAFNFLIEGTFKEKTELLIISRSEINSSSYDSFIEGVINYETPKIYDPSFWKDYHVMEPLKEMKEFKVED